MKRQQKHPMIIRGLPQTAHAEQEPAVRSQPTEQPAPVTVPTLLTPISRDPDRVSRCPDSL